MKLNHAARTTHRQIARRSSPQRLKALEEEIIERLARVEENLRLLRVELVGNGRPGRIGQLEHQVDELRVAHHRHRGVFLAISFVVSAAITLLSQLLLQ